MLSKILKVLTIVFFLLGLLVVGTLATETRLLFFWPGCALLGVAALCMLASGGWRLSYTPSDICMGLALLFGLFMLLRGFTSPVMVYAREDVFILLGCAVVYMISATAMSDARLRIVVLWIFVLLTVGNLVVGFIHFSGRWNFHIVPTFMRSFGEGARIGGFYNNSNHLAAFLGMMTLLFTGIAVFGRLSVGSRLLLTFLSLASALGIALSVSRGALLGLCAGGLVLGLLSVVLLWKAYPHLFFKLFAGVAVLGLMGGFMLFQVFAYQMHTRLMKSGTESFAEGDPRPFIWMAALQQQGNPLWGAGSRVFYDGCIRFRTPDTPMIQEALFVHNDWLQLLSEYGLIGVGLLCLVLLAHFLNGIKFIRWFITERFPRTGALSSRNLGFVAGAFAALVGTLVHAAVEFQFHVAATALTAAFLLGVLANPGIIAVTKRPKRIPGVRPLLKLTLLGAGVWMIYGTFVFGRAEYYLEMAERQKVEEDMGLSTIVSLSKAIEIDPQNARSWFERGQTRYRSAMMNPPAVAKSLLTRSVTDLEQARRLNPFSMYYALALMDAYDAVGRYDEALQCAKAGLLLAPLYATPRVALGQHYQRQGRFEEAEQAYLWARETKGVGGDSWSRQYRNLLRQVAAQ